MNWSARRFLPPEIARLGLWLIFVFGTAQARQPSKDTLWLLEGRKNQVFLMGAVHLLPASAYPLSSALQNAYRRADALVLELNLAEISSSQMSRAYEKICSYRRGDSLVNHISPSTLRWLKLVLKELDFPLSRAIRIKPALLSQIIAARYSRLAGFRDDLGIDRVFYNRALHDHKPIVGLESITDQLNILVADDENPDRDLRSTLESLPAYGLTLERVVQAWEHGKIGVLDQLLNANQKSNPRSFDRMFAKRNRRWLPRIEALTQANRSYLVIVGAGHLVGDDGLVQTLRSKGYQLKQL